MIPGSGTYMSTRRNQQDVINSDDEVPVKKVVRAGQKSARPPRLTGSSESGPEKRWRQTKYQEPAGRDPHTQGY